jgi:hypothetical protein
MLMCELQRKLLDKATKALMTCLEMEDRSYSEAEVRKIVETAFNELGSVDLITLISRANAILLNLPMRNNHSVMVDEVCSLSLASVVLATER